MGCTRRSQSPRARSFPFQLWRLPAKSYASLASSPVHPVLQQPSADACVSQAQRALVGTGTIGNCASVMLFGQHHSRTKGVSACDREVGTAPFDSFPYPHTDSAPLALRPVSRGCLRGHEVPALLYPPCALTLVFLIFINRFILLSSSTASFVSILFVLFFPFFFPFGDI